MSKMAVKTGVSDETRMASMYSTPKMKSMLDFIEVVFEVYEREENHSCPFCHTLETLCFHDKRLVSGARKWKQLPSGRVVHLCHLNPYYNLWLTY